MPLLLRVMKMIAGFYYGFLLVMPRRYMLEWSSLDVAMFYAFIGLLLVAALAPTQRLVSRKPIFIVLLGFTALPTVATIGMIITSSDPFRGVEPFAWWMLGAMLFTQLCLPASLVIQRNTKVTLSPTRDLSKAANGLPNV